MQPATLASLTLSIGLHDIEIRNRTFCLEVGAATHTHTHTHVQYSRCILYTPQHGAEYNIAQSYFNPYKNTYHTQRDQKTPRGIYQHYYSLFLPILQSPRQIKMKIGHVPRITHNHSPSFCQFKSINGLNP